MFAESCFGQRFSYSSTTGYEENTPLCIFCYVFVVPGGDKNPRWDDPPFAAWITSCECRAHQLLSLYLILAIFVTGQANGKNTFLKDCCIPIVSRATFSVGLTEGGPSQGMIVR